MIFKPEVGFEIAKSFLDLFILELRFNCNKFVPFRWALVDQIESFSKLFLDPQLTNNTPSWMLEQRIQNANAFLQKLIYFVEINSFGFEWFSTKGASVIEQEVN